MPADYNSTARALSLSTSPPDSPSQNRQSFVPQWSRTRSSSSARRSQSTYDPRNRSFKEQCMHSIDQIYRQTAKIVDRMSLWQKIIAVVSLVVLGIIGLLMLIFSERIFSWLEPYADSWRALRAGWLIVWFITFLCAFPPAIGYSTSVTVAGFLYGFPNGWFVVASATVVGSLCSFIASRTILSRFVHRLVENDKRFAALALTLKHDGLKLLIMIRFCPLPYSLSNGAMSTFPTVHPLMFALATAISTPKLIVHVFIGGRLASLAAQGAKMDAGTKAINYASIVGGGTLGVVIGWFIYQRLTVARARQLESEERAHLQGGDGLRRDSGSGAARFSDDPADGDVTSPLASRDDTDEISLFEHGGVGDAVDVDDDARFFDEADGYNDDDGDDDAFKDGDGEDGDEEATIGMGKGMGTHRNGSTSPSRR
ncbi:MAG: hypothetical protein M1825_002947 [Sarcosagium campestre]|nr:MAG: hypothetical protein M1825_002947 [Sarcosagium campestre]